MSCVVKFDFQKTSPYSKGINRNESKHNNSNDVTGPAGGGRVEKKQFQQSASTHSGAEEKETLNIKLWEKRWVAKIENIFV